MGESKDVCKVDCASPIEVSDGHDPAGGEPQEISLRKSDVTFEEIPTNRKTPGPVKK
jgi:hypothetical protein